MHVKIRLILTLVVVLSTVATVAVADDTAKIAQLLQEYGNTNDRVERLIIASKLARAGDYRYWSFVRGEATKAVKYDRVRVRWYSWLLRLGHVQHQTNRSMNYILQPVDEPTRPLVRDTVADQEIVDVNAYTLDVWRILAFSSAARREEKELLLLREAVRSPRNLIAAYAALGLARLRDEQSAEVIAEAGGRAKDAERVLFVEALVCLNDENATKLAKRVAGENADVLLALQKLAARKQYNPFAER